MNQKRIVVLGSSYAALAAGTALRELSPQKHTVTLISKRDQIAPMPSPVEIVFDDRAGQRPGVSVRERLDTLGIRYVPHDGTQLDLERRRIAVGPTHELYDELIIATGARPNYGAIPGLGPQGYTQCVSSLAAAERARAAFQRFMQKPGPLVVGTVAGAVSHHAAYDFMLRAAEHLQRSGLKVPLTFVTAEPRVGHFGTGESHVARSMTEALFDRLGIRAITGASIRSIARDELVLATGERVPFGYAMIVPSMLGVDLVRACDDITDARGFVRIDRFCRTHEHPEVFAAGAAAAVLGDEAEPAHELVMTARPTQQMGRTAAINAIADLEGTEAAAFDARTIRSQCVAETIEQAVSMLSWHYRAQSDQTAGNAAH